MSPAGSSFRSVGARSAIFSREELLIFQEFILLNETAKEKCLTFH